VSVVSREVKGVKVCQGVGVSRVKGCQRVLGGQRVSGVSNDFRSVKCQAVSKVVNQRETNGYERYQRMSRGFRGDNGCQGV